MTTKTDVDIVLSAVELCENEHWNAEGDMLYPCSDVGCDLCNGSGSVRQFPELWEECPQHYARACATDGPFPACSTDCPANCSGTGWVYAPTTERLLEALLLVGAEVTIFRHEGKIRVESTLGSLGSYEGDTLQETLKLVLAGCGAETN